MRASSTTFTSSNNRRPSFSPPPRNIRRLSKQKKKNLPSHWTLSLGSFATFTLLLPFHSKYLSKTTPPPSGSSQPAMSTSFFSRPFFFVLCGTAGVRTT